MGLAGDRNPIPPEDVYVSPSVAKEADKPSEQPGGSSVNPATETPDADAMSLDPLPPLAPSGELNNFFNDAVLGQGDIRAHGDILSHADVHSEHESDDDAPETPSVSTSVPANGSSAATREGESSEQAAKSGPAATKEDLDKERTDLRENMIERCLEAIQAHPNCAIEISDLIRDVVLRQTNDEMREEVGSTLANALSSLKTDDDDESQPNARSISAYAHLLALLLQDEKFFSCNLETLSDKVDEYISFLDLALPSATEEMPSWIPDILLILEILLSEGEQPVEVQWNAPSTDSDPIPPFVLPPRNQIVNKEQRAQLFDFVVEILPRIGKEKTFAICVLRILVILTRDRDLAQKIGDKKNLQRLFVMTKQLAGAGLDCIKDARVTSSIMNILRHVVEDEETTKQIMRAEIKNALNPQRTQRQLDVSTYLRNMASVALRAPDLFVEATNEMVKISRWSNASSEGTARVFPLALKEPVEEPKVVSSGSTETAQPAGESSAEVVKPTTEGADKEMADISKPGLGPELKRPVLENPDGIVHFLLTELLNYRDVDDKEPSSKDQKTVAPTTASEDPAVSTLDGQVTAADGKDKKPPKPVFKAEEHPIFIYRCFLLHCLSELLQSYTRTKVEFINFKRKVPVQTNTPVKPRSSVLNYLIHDLLCQGSVSGGSVDSLATKKKMATSNHAQQVLVALVAKTSEKSFDYRGREKYEYDDDSDLLFVRKFALDTILRAYEKASAPEEPLEARYSKMQSLAELLNYMIGDRDKDHAASTRGAELGPSFHSQTQLRRMMYEKGYLDRLTSSIAEIDLSYPNVKRALKYILRVLRILTNTAKELSHSSVISSTSLPDNAEDDFASASSLSDLDDDREETPDLYRNSSLGMLEPRDDDDESEDEDGSFQSPFASLILSMTSPARMPGFGANNPADDEEMYDDEYGDEMDYGEDELSDDGEENVSDEDEDLGEIGEIEGLHGDPSVVEVIMGEDDDDDSEDELSEDEDDEVSSGDIEDMEEDVEIVDEEGNPLEDDGNSGWENETDEDAEEDEEDGDDDEDGEDHLDIEFHAPAAAQMLRLNNLTRAVLDAGHDFDDFIDDGPEHFDDGREEDGKKARMGRP